MNFGTAIQSFFANYANFKGRARRSEYWFAYLFTVLVSIVANIITPTTVNESGMAQYGVAPLVWALAIIVPGLAVATRRLHDTGRSGATLFLALIPFVGAAILLVYLVQDSAAGPNQYGDPVK